MKPDVKKHNNNNSSLHLLSTCCVPETKFLKVFSFTSHNSAIKYVFIFPFLHMWKVRHGLNNSTWQNQDVNLAI